MKGRQLPGKRHFLEIFLKKFWPVARAAGNNKFRPAGRRPTGRKKKRYAVDLHGIVHTHGRLSPLPGTGFLGAVQALSDFVETLLASWRLPPWAADPASVRASSEGKENGGLDLLKAAAL